MSNVLKNLDWSVLTGMLSMVIPALICITFHELSHGFTAYLLGDNTARDSGRLTLNPIKHIDISGLVMMVVFKFGWAKPVPVNMMNFKRPKRDMAITALAGPISNILLAVVVLFIYGLLYLPLGRAASGSFGAVVLEMVYITAYLSTALAVFNLIPIPPLDGSKVLFSAISDDLYFKLMRYERYGVLILIVVLATNVLDPVIGGATQTLFGGLFKIAEGVYNIAS